MLGISDVDCKPLFLVLWYIQVDPVIDPMYFIFQDWAIFSMYIWRLFFFLQHLTFSFCNIWRFVLSYTHNSNRNYTVLSLRPAYKGIRRQIMKIGGNCLWIIGANQKILRYLSLKQWAMWELYWNVEFSVCKTADLEKSVQKQLWFPKTTLATLLTTCK